MPISLLDYILYDNGKDVSVISQVIRIDKPIYHVRLVANIKDNFLYNEEDIAYVYIITDRNIKQFKVMEWHVNNRCP